MKKIFATVLAGSLIMLSGCSYSFNINLGGRFSEKKAIKVFEETLDAEECDPDDLLDPLEDMDYEDFEDGVYTTLDKKETKKAFDAMELDQFFPSIKSAESSVVYFKTNPLTESDRYVFYACAAKFDSKDDADEFFEDTLDVWEDISEDVEFDDDDLKEAFMYNDDGNVDLYLGVYRDGTQVLFVVNINDGDSLDDLCDEFKITSPTTLE